MSENGKETEKERQGEKRIEEREQGMEEGEKVTETNAPALTAVLHFLSDRHTNEDHKSNESLSD